MSRSPAATLNDVAESGWAEYSLPWLMSASVHCSLLIILGLCVSLSPTPVASGVSATGADLVSAVFSSQAGDYYDDEGPPLEGLDGDPSGAETPDAPAEPAGGEAGVQNPSPDAAAAVVDGTAGDFAATGPLASLLGSGSPVDLAGALPSANPVLGSGALSGGGVGTAQGATSGSQGTKGGGGLRGGSARTGVFGIESEGFKFVYVFDRSGSMGGHGGAPLAGAKAQLIASLQKLGPTHQFQIIFYNEHPHVFSPSGTPGRLVFGDEATKYLAGQFIGGIIADGATEHEDALAMALRMVPDVIFFLTDADEPRLNVRQLEHIQRINKGTVINAIEFGFGPQDQVENFLVQLARQNGGRHVYVDISTLPRPD